MTPAELRAEGERLAHIPEWGPNPPAWGTGLVQADWEAEAHIVETAYEHFLDSKRRTAEAVGFQPSDLSPHLFDWQARIVEWACRRGRAAIFADCGLGKTIQQLEWARQVARHTDGRVFIVAPLAVGFQTERESSRFNIGDAKYCKTDDPDRRIIVTNYQRVESFNPNDFTGIVLDESSILKAIDGKTRRILTEFASDIHYRLCCTATPAPNDHMELGNHSEFLAVMPLAEMLATFFVHDGGQTSKWKLKGHAEDDFWDWLASWSVAIRKPSDIGGDDAGFELPALNTHQVQVASPNTNGSLFTMEARTLSERREARKASIGERVSVTAEMVNVVHEPWIVWCNLNAESEALARAIPDAVEIRGSHDPEFKEQAMLQFSDGAIRVLVTKPRIAGFGMNWQHCAHMAFVGLSDSYEQFYQAVRRCWRFGQKREVNAYVVTAEAEGAVVRNIERKEKQVNTMMENVSKAVSEHHELKNRRPMKTKPTNQRTQGDGWEMIQGDCVEVLKGFESESIDYSVFSPPFASLYTYTDSSADMGNCQGHKQFFEHLAFLIPELYRVTKPGRLLSFHCMDLPTLKVRDGFIGLRDFRGELIRAFEKASWIYHSNVTIWKDPVTQMQRTKSVGLLWKQLKKDSAMSRQGIPDYLITMRKPGENQSPIGHKPEEFPVSRWQEWASPVWTDINPSDTLQRDSAREEKDEKHIAPLQLEVIRRALILWSNPEDLVLSPFAGIGSEGYEAVKNDRRFIGIELKRSYYEQAVNNLKVAEKKKTQGHLFTGSGVETSR